MKLNNFCKAKNDTEKPEILNWTSGCFLFWQRSFKCSVFVNELMLYTVFEFD